MLLWSLSREEKVVLDWMLQASGRSAFLNLIVVCESLSIPVPAGCLHLRKNGKAPKEGERDKQEISYEQKKLMSFGQFGYYSKGELRTRRFCQLISKEMSTATHLSQFLKCQDVPFCSLLTKSMADIAQLMGFMDFTSGRKKLLDNFIV